MGANAKPDPPHTLPRSPWSPIRSPASAFQPSEAGKSQRLRWRSPYLERRLMLLSLAERRLGIAERLARRILISAILPASRIALLT